VTLTLTLAPGQRLSEERKKRAEKSERHWRVPLGVTLSLLRISGMDDGADWLSDSHVETVWSGGERRGVAEVGT
jgi:hypothetical protein